MYSIRYYTSDDFIMIHKWNAHYGELGPSKDMIPESSFILEKDGVPSLFLSVIETNTQGNCYLENYCGNPELKGNRIEEGKSILNFAKSYASAKGYKRMIALGYKNKIKDLYEQYGLTRTKDDISSFVMGV